MLAEQPESGDPSMGHVSDSNGSSSEQQIYAAGQEGEAVHHRDGAGEDLQEARKAKRNIPAVVLLLVLVVCAGGAALWYFNHIPVQVPKKADPHQAGAVQQAQPTATVPANTQPVVGQPQVPLSGPNTNLRQPSAEALLLEAKKQFTSNPEEAQKLLEEALTLNPNHYDCVLSLARLLASRNDSQAAIQRYKQALVLNSHVAEVHYELGNVYMGQADFDMAIQSFEACLRLTPLHRDEVLASMGTCYMKKGDFDKAELFFKLSLEANPDNTSARSYMARVIATPPPSISPGAGATPFLSGQFGEHTAPQGPLPFVKTPLKGSEVRLEGNYTLDGTYPDGTKYNGTAWITQTDGKYSVRWKTGDRTFAGTGTLSGKILTINRQGPGAENGVVVYGMGANGMLKGTWGSGKGKEILKRVD